MVGTTIRAAFRCAKPSSATIWWSLAFSVVSAPCMVFAEADSADCPETMASQKSVIVATDKVTDEPMPSWMANAATEALEPIANVSEYEPDLADPPEPVEESDYYADDEPAADETVAEEAYVEETPAVEKSAAVTPASIEAASFYGATPGATKRGELIEQWGSPVDGDSTSNVLVYELPSFPRVTVRFENDVVTKIRVQLAKPFVTNSLTERLKLAQIETFTRTNANGEVQSTVFPERGVTFNHRADLDVAYVSDSEKDSADDSQGQHLVHGLIVESIQAEHFCRRAQQRPQRNLHARVTDLQTALKLDPSYTDAKFELSQIDLAMGRPSEAGLLAEQALAAQPENPQYRLQLAQCQTTAAKYDVAVESCRELLESADVSSLVRAQTLYQMGVLSALGSKEVAKQTVPLHTKAIELADQLATDSDPAVAAAASQLLVDAHLAIANAIAGGEWKEKETNVAQWIGRASGLAEEQIENDPQQLPLRLKVAVEALAAGAQLNPPIDPKLWVAEAEETAAKLQAATSDEDACETYQWQLGLAYYYATEIQHRRGQDASALRYGDLAESQLVELAESRRELPDADFLLGRLYFQVGAIHAVHREDHDIACEYYDKAAPLLMQPTPVTKFASPGRHGDALVSMGVSYWHAGQRDRALELTKSGVELVDQGISEGLLNADARNVPMGNLAAMDRALNQTSQPDPSITPTPDSPKTQMARRPTVQRTASRPQRQPTNRGNMQRR